MKQDKPFNFRKTESARIDKLFLKLEFEGGDGDTQHPITFELEGIKYSEYTNHLDEINSIIGDYKILKKILSVNSKDYLESYEEVLEAYGEKIAHLYEEVPNDPQSDYSTKCYLDYIILVGYDESGNRHESYV